MSEHAYIHIPFCIRKCNYCSFVSGENIKNKNEYINALILEIKKRYKDEPLKTLYFGGGTPSLLDAEDVEKIISCFNFDKNPEITIEVNPETVELNKFHRLKAAGINRISLGVQSFDNNILNIIGRKHTDEIVFNAIKTIKNTGFNNISIDLIYGLPNQTFEIFKKDLNKAIEADINHISTYGLKIESNSLFYKNPPENIPDDEHQAKMFLYLCKYLKEHNFEHYEISNFAKRGFESKHNLCYWQNKNYYGFGLNASGYEKITRYKNTSDFKEYVDNPFKREEEIELSENQIKEEEIFLALRLREGISLKKIEKKYDKIIEKYQKLNLLKIENGYLKLTEQGILLSNEIMSEFID